jgi:hypothetical protein
LSDPPRLWLPNEGPPKRPSSLTLVVPESLCATRSSNTFAKPSLSLLVHLPCSTLIVLGELMEVADTLRLWLARHQAECGATSFDVIARSAAAGSHMILTCTSCTHSISGMVSESDCTNLLALVGDRAIRKT